MTRWAVVAILLAACGPAHKGASTPAGSGASPWLAPIAGGSFGTVYHYELILARSIPARQRQCHVAAFEEHFSEWSGSRRGVLQIGRKKWGRVFFHDPSDSKRGPNGELCWSLPGDGEAIHVVPTDHLLPLLCRAIDRHQDPFLEGDTPLFLPWNPSPPYAALALSPRWVEVEALDAAARIRAYVATQNMGCH